MEVVPINVLSGFNAHLKISNSVSMGDASLILLCVQIKQMAVHLTYQYFVRIKPNVYKILHFAKTKLLHIQI